MEGYDKKVKELKKLMGLESLYCLATEVLGYSLVKEEPHRGVCKFIERWGGKKRKKLMLLPRGSFKTTLGTIAYSIQQIILNPNIRILIASETLHQAIKFLNGIKGRFENEVFQYYYGNFVKDKGWTESEITVNCRTWNRNEPTISTAGIDVTRTGMHYDLVIIDDCHSQKNVTTREQIDQVKQWYKLLLSMLEPEGKLLIWGTRWDYDDLYGHILKNLQDEFDILVEKAIRDDGGLFFPSRLTKDFLNSQRKEQGSYIFSSQYQNEPIAREDQVFRQEDILFYDEFYKDIVIESLDIFITLDPSLTIEERTRGDSTAIVVCGVDELNNWYFLDLVNAKLTPEQINQELLRLCKKWKPIGIGIESVVFSKLLKPAFEAYCIEHGETIPPVTELKTGGKSKEFRIGALQPFYEQHKVYMKKPDFENGDIWDDFYDQLLRYPKTSFDDIIDSAAYLPQMIYYREMITKTEEEENPYLNDKDGPWFKEEQKIVDVYSCEM